MLERKISHYIEHFYEVNKGALLLAGARQIGKTYSIRRFAEKHFESFIEINFVESPEAVEIFSIKGDTLIFFDEVQLCPEIVTAIKFLVDDGRYRYVLSGSLLGVELNNLRSVPVGYMSIKDMFPLDLEEFMWAVGVNKDVIGALKTAWENKQPVDAFRSSQDDGCFSLISDSRRYAGCRQCLQGEQQSSGCNGKATGDNQIIQKRYFTV